MSPHKKLYQASNPKAREEKVLQHKCLPEGLPEQTGLSGQQSVICVVVCVCVCCYCILSTSPIQYLESDVEDMLIICLPIFEQSLCCADTVAVHTGSDLKWITVWGRHVSSWHRQMLNQVCSSVNSMKCVKSVKSKIDVIFLSKKYKASL